MTQWRPGRGATEHGGRPPLPVLPRFPGVRGFADLDAAIRRTGFRHAAEVLRIPDEEASAAPTTAPGGPAGFHILDGLGFPAPGGRWRRVDLGYVRASRARWLAATDDPRAGTAADVVGTLETVLRDDRMGLRRLVLWQLGRLLVDGPDGPTPEAAVALGVHEDEAGPLAAAVAASFPPDGPVRRAAETINDVWPGDRPRTARRLAQRLDPAGDHRLIDLLAQLRAREDEVERLTRLARHLDHGGDLAARTATWFRVTQLAADDETALAGLLRAAAACADDPDTAPGPTARADPARHAVRLAWRRAARHTSEVTYRVLRFPDNAPEQAVEVRAPDAAVTAEDAGPPRGAPLRYAVVPLHQGRIAEVPHVTAALLLAPDVTDVRVEPVPWGLRLRWRTDPSVCAVRAVRTAGGGVAGTEVPCGRSGLLDQGDGTDSGLAPGEHTYRISCGYRGPRGTVVWSEGRSVTGTAVRWPSAVRRLTVRSAGPGHPLEISCGAAEHGQVRVVSGLGPVPFGSDVSHRMGRFGAAPVDLAPPPGARARLTAVSVLGERAVAGSSVVVEHPGPVEGLTAVRLAADRAEVRFRWPEPAVLVRLTWEQRGRGRTWLSLPRSRFLAEGSVTLPVDAGECLITVVPVPRPDAVLVAAPRPARVVLPAWPVFRWGRPVLLPALWARWRHWRPAPRSSAADATRHP
mgnify:CR=1 FL=1